MKTLFLLVTSLCFAQLDYFPQQDLKISVQNKILAKVNGNVISVVDVMKKMDVLMHQNYPQYAESAPARLQFYINSWRTILMEMIDTELIMSDAQDKEMKLTDGEIREEMENRFGPSVLQTLDTLRLSYDDAWKMVRKDLIMQRMLWFFVQSKAISNVSPESIRQAYRIYLEAHPAYQEFIYRVVTIRGADPSDLEVGERSLEEALQEWQASRPGVEVQISQEYDAKQHDLSAVHREALSALTPGSYSKPLIANNRSDGKQFYRIFHLIDRKDISAPSFEVVAPKLKNELQQKAVAKASEEYLNKLRKHYGFDPERLKEVVADNFQPFSLQ